MLLKYKDELKQFSKLEINRKQKNDLSLTKSIFVFQHIEDDFAIILDFWQLVRLCFVVNFNMFILQKLYHVNKTCNTIGFNKAGANKLCFSTSLSQEKNLCISRFCRIWESNNYHFLALLHKIRAVLAPILFRGNVFKLFAEDI